MKIEKLLMNGDWQLVDNQEAERLIRYAESSYGHSVISLLFDGYEVRYGGNLHSVIRMAQKPKQKLHPLTSGLKTESE